MVFIGNYNEIHRESVSLVHIPIDFFHPNHFQTDSNMFGNDFSSQTQINHQKYDPKYVSAQKLKNEVSSPFNTFSNPCT